MKAWGLYGGKYMQIERREYDLPPPGPNEALVEVRACGACGTDLNFLRDWDKGLHEMGHELSGVVAEVGSCVKNVRVGDKVVVEDLAYCGVCEDCQNGRIDLCRNMLSGGGRPGMASHMLLDAHCLVPFDGLSFEAASLTEPLAVGICAAEAADIPLGGSVAVIGHGPIGLFSARCAQLKGAGTVFVVGTSRDTPLGKKRFETAEALGCRTIESRHMDAAAEIKKLFPKGVDRVIVTSPPKTAPMAFDMVKFGGIVELLGIDFSGHNVIELDVNRVVFNRIDVKGVIAEPAMHFNTSLALLKSGAVDPAMFLHVCDGIDEFSAALRGVLERTVGANKVCLKIS